MKEKGAQTVGKNIDVTVAPRLNPRISVSHGTSLRPGHCLKSLKLLILYYIFKKKSINLQNNNR